MKNDGYNETGGVYQEWLESAIARGLLEPESVKALAAEIVGQGAVDKWGRRWNKVPPLRHAHD